MKALELFAGIGGFAASAHKAGVEIAAAIDHDRRSAGVYCESFGQDVVIKNLDFLKPAALAKWGADLWWMSPPCRPHTIRGNQEDLSDPRSRCFVSVVEAVREVRPRAVALENVPWFARSKARELLISALDGYRLREGMLCPTALGIPNRRRRYYLLAVRDGDLTEAPPWPEPDDGDLDDGSLQSGQRWVLGGQGSALRAYLDADAPPDLDVEPALRERYGQALHVVEADDPQTVTACFTSAYGRSPVYCGSYLRDRGRLRRFSPGEIARLLGHPGDKALDALDRRLAWHLIGNSLSVDAVSKILTAWTLWPASDPSSSR